MCKLQCVEVHTLLKKSGLDIFQHTVIYTFFLQFHYYFNSFFLLVSSYVLKLYPHVIGMDK